MYPFNVIAKKNVAKVVYSILTHLYCSENFSFAWNSLTIGKNIAQWNAAYQPYIQSAENILSILVVLGLL